MPQSTFKEDDVFSINSVYDSIKTTMEYLDDIFENTPGENLNPLLLSVPFGSFYDKMNSLLKQLDQLIPYMTGVSNVSVSRPNQVEAVDDAEFQDAVEPPQELDGAGMRRPRLLRGSGRYKVLSDRAHVIQSQPYKRFL